MNTLCQRLNLTSLPTQLPALLEAARQQQRSYEAFFQTVLTAELEERQRRAQVRRLRQRGCRSRLVWSALIFGFSRVCRNV